MHVIQVVAVDATEGGQSLAQKYGVQGFPTLKVRRWPAWTHRSLRVQARQPSPHSLCACQPGAPLARLDVPQAHQPAHPHTSPPGLSLTHTPTLPPPAPNKVFGADKKKPVDYNGQRTSDGIVSECMRAANQLVKVGSIFFDAPGSPARWCVQARQPPHPSPAPPFPSRTERKARPPPAGAAAGPRAAVGPSPPPAAAAAAAGPRGARAAAAPSSS